MKLTDKQVLDEFERRAMTLRDAHGTPTVDGGRVIDGVRALLAATPAVHRAAEQEPAAEVVKWRTFTGHDAWDFKVFDKTLQNGDKLYRAAATLPRESDSAARVEAAVAETLQRAGETPADARRMAREAVAPQQIAEPAQEVAQGDERAAFEAVAHYQSMSPSAWFKLGWQARATAPQPATMPPLTDAMRAVLRNERDLYGSEDELYAALCVAAGERKGEGE